MEIEERWITADGVHLEEPAARDDVLHWTLVVDPDEADLSGQLAELLGRVGLDRATAQHLLAGRGTGVRRPSLRRHGETTAVSIRLLDYHDATDAVESGEEWLLLRGPEAVSVLRTPANSTGAPAPAPVLHGWTPEGPLVVDLLHAVLLSALAGYEEVLSQLGVDVDEVEVSVFSPRRTADAERIYTLKRELAECRRAVMPLVDLFQRELVDDPVLGRWRAHRGAADVLERLHRVVEHVEGLDQLLSSVLGAYVARVSVQQNEDMRRISAGAALIVVPTFLAGVWGMNFHGMPELRWSLGYPLALTAMVVCVAVMWWQFRRTGWF